MSVPRVTSATPFEQWPLYMTVEEFAIVAGRSKKALANRAAAGTIWPPPISDEHGPVRPLRFHREQVHQALNGQLPRPRRLVDRWRMRQSGARRIPA